MDLHCFRAPPRVRCGSRATLRTGYQACTTRPVSGDQIIEDLKERDEVPDRQDLEEPAVFSLWCKSNA